MATAGTELDAARRLVVERNLVRAAFEHLTADALMTVPFEALGPTKTLLKRFFSGEPWGSEEDDALAAAVGPGQGEWHRTLDAELTLEYGWVGGRFRLRVSGAHGGPPVPAAAPPPRNDLLAATFDGPVVPEATPNPRTIRFQVGPIHDGPSRWYESAASAAADASATRLFAEVDEVANVLVGPDFVAVGLRRAADWERLLHRVLTLVTEEFAPAGAGPGDGGPPRVTGGPAGAGVPGGGPPAAPGSRRVSR
ncbi:MAG TPA: NifU N-terminal domain-containing protein, partial [Acidimicrobiales bacterium]|nr:NifU N-terminal domain-containing protein [Acidimicrobiales bacterium]